MNTFQSYLEKNCSLDFEQMQALHDEIIEELGNDVDAKELYEDLITEATRYAGIRASWGMLSNEEKMDKDKTRTACHNSVITHFNMLSRYLRMQGKTAAWRDKLGYEEDNAYYRKTIGDFACYIVFVNSVHAR